MDKTFLFGDLKHLQILNKWESNQVGQLVVLVDNFDEVDRVNQNIYETIDYDLDTRTVIQQHAEIFEWIGIFDQNTRIILIIMIIVAGINMITALLVLILERIPMIGLLKALGGQRISVQKIFLINTAYLIGRGLLLGNFIGLGLLVGQAYFGFIPLDPSVYYVTEVPVSINILDVLFLNIGVFLLSMMMLLIPSSLVRGISPVNAMRFQ